MPRSGTSLVEQIITSHSQVFGAGELPILPNIIRENMIIDGKIITSKALDIIENSSQVKRMSKKYLEYLSYFNYNEKFIQIYDKEIRFMINYCNQIGVDAYILPIKKNLPFSYTRINLLIKKYD